MIVRMSKIMVVGPLELLMKTLSLVNQLGIMHVDADVSVSQEDAGIASVPQLLDKESVLQHQLYDNLRKKIDELLFYLSLPQVKPQGKIPPVSIKKLVLILPSHLAETRKRKIAMDVLVQQIAEYEKYKVFVDAIAGLEDGGMRGDVRYIGLKIQKNQDYVTSLQNFLEQEYQGKVTFELVSKDDSATGIGIVISESDDGDEVRRRLETKGVILFNAPENIDTLPFSQQLKSIEIKITEKRKKLSLLRKQQESFIEQWYLTYKQNRAWIDTQLSLISVTASVVKTRMCFFIYGWVAASDFEVLNEKLQEKFKGKVVAEEHELVEQDFSRIPTALHNPVYFEPFELFTRLLPMPPYASFDLTPFIGIFFPVFFGMMLGDVGYGLILLIASAYMVRRFESKKNLRDAGKILFISSLYTIVFGILYGELIGNVGHLYLGLKPVLFDRQASIVPMFCFAIAAGVVHVIIGLVLGFIVSVRRKMKKEAVFKLGNIFVILCISVLVVSYLTQSMAPVQKPLLLTIAVATSVLLLVGGLMAPLELLKNVGNIISYVRIMAIGMTSVLLAFVANDMAGRMGSIWAGIVVAVLLHFFNLLLGVFAPTIHSLRLHYVEFLSKFMEPGGKEFKPLGGK